MKIMNCIGKEPIRRFCMILLTYLIPLINIIMVVSNYKKIEVPMITICSVLSSTAAASACTIKGIKGDKDNALNIMQAFALVFSVTPFMCCVIFGISKILYMPLFVIIIMTVVANIITVFMFLRADNDLKTVMDEYKEAQKMIEASQKVSQEANGRMNLTKKGGK